jgi:hypothetical protein
MVGASIEMRGWSMPVTPIPRELGVTWQRTLELWTQPASHDTMLGMAAKHQQYAWLAARYREASRTNPDDPVALQRLARVQRAAIAVMAFEASEREAPVSRRLGGLGGILIAVVLTTAVGLWVTNLRTQQHQHHPQPALSSQR